MLQLCSNYCRLNLVHTKYFLDLFKEGRWGSSLEDPISGAGMCFSADSLSEKDLMLVSLLTRLAVSNQFVGRFG